MSQTNRNEIPNLAAGVHRAVSQRGVGVGRGVRVGIGVMQLLYRGGRGTQAGTGGKGPLLMGLSFWSRQAARSLFGQHGPSDPFGQRTVGSVASGPSLVASKRIVNGVPSCSVNDQVPGAAETAELFSTAPVTPTALEKSAPCRYASSSLMLVSVAPLKTALTSWAPSKTASLSEPLKWAPEQIALLKLAESSRVRISRVRCVSPY